MIGMDDHSILECRTSDLDFYPKVGTEVEVYSDGYTQVITEKMISKAMNASQEGVNIHIDNRNNTDSSLVYKQGKVVSKTAYLLLCFFLGGLGLHKFYAGKILLGVLYLIFCWTYLPVFIAFVEFIFACFKKADMNGNIVV